MAVPVMPASIAAVGRVLELSRRQEGRCRRPGSGKTSLAVPLAAELGYALLTKDRIKETLHDAFGAPVADLAWSRRLGAAAMELLWALAADAPAVVIEANFRPYSAYERTDRKITYLKWARGSEPWPGVVVGPGQGRYGVRRPG
jgi:hypothetical protein